MYRRDTYNLNAAADQCLLSRDASRTTRWLSSGLCWARTCVNDSGKTNEKSDVTHIYSSKAREVCSTIHPGNERRGQNENLQSMHGRKVTV